MKNTIIVFIIFSLNFVFPQQKNIYIEYSVKIYDEERLNGIDPEFRKMFVEAMTEAEKMSFGLIITNSSSKFFDNAKMATSDYEYFKSSSTSFAGYTGEVFQYLNNLYKNSSSLAKNMMVKEPLKSNWILHNETKLIDNYLCYKATNVNVVDNRSGKIFNHPVIAWYCPKLPYNYGPNGYSNLPGLILELQVRNVVFGAKKIDLNSELNFDTTFLKTVKTITLSELNDKLHKQADSWRE